MIPPDPRHIIREMIRERKSEAEIAGRKYWASNEMIYADMEGKGAPNAKWGAEGLFYLDISDHSVWRKKNEKWEYIRRLPFGNERKSIGYKVQIRMFGRQNIKDEEGGWVERCGLWSIIYEYDVIG